MAANNLRIVYDNQVDYNASTITASSTASSSLIASNLKSDVRGLVWRSATHTNLNIPAVFKNVSTVAASGKHSNLTITATASTGTPTLYYTWTATGTSETSNTTALSTGFTTAILDTESRAGYIFRLYNNTTIGGSTLLDQQTVPVVLSIANTATAVLTNQYHRIPGTTASNSMVGSGTNIIVYDGTTPLRYDGVGTTRGTFTVNAVGTSVTAGSVSAGTGNAFATYGPHTTPTASPSTVTYTITGRTFNNTSINIVTTQTLVLSGGLSTDAFFSSNFDSTLSRAILEVENIPTGASPVGLVALNCCNLGQGSTMRVWGYNGTVSINGANVDLPVPNIASVVPAFDTGPQICQPFLPKTQDSWVTTGYGTTTFGLDRQLARVYIAPGIQVTSGTIMVEVVDFQNTVNYIEASRLIMGRYWSPVYNTSYGLGVSLVDTSEANRSEAGDLITTMGVVYKTMNFDLSWLTKADRDELVRLLRQRGKRRPLFVSLFPENSDDWEEENLYQMYCMLSDSVPINHPYLEFFSSTIQLEEV